MTPYATNAEADIINAGITAWTSLPEPTKTTHLIWARRYIDKYYVLPLIDMAAVQEEIIEGSAKLALANITTPLYSIRPKATIVKSKSVGASGATTSKTFAGGDVTLVDPFPEVTMILSTSCSLRTGSINSVCAGRS